MKKQKPVKPQETTLAPVDRPILLPLALLAFAATLIYVFYAVQDSYYHNLNILYGWAVYEADPIERPFTLWFTVIGLLMTAAITVGLTLLAKSMRTLVGERSGESQRPERSLKVAARIAIGIAVFALVLTAKFVVLHNSPTMDDENVYRFSAQLLLHRELSLPTNIPAEFFGQRWGVSYRDGRLYPMYSFGWPAILAMGYAIGVPWIISPLIAVGIALLALDFAYRIYGDSVAKLAALLFLLSPILILTASTDLSPPSAALCALAIVAGAIRYIEDAQVRWLWIAGCAAGLAFQIRQLNAVAMAVPFFVYLMHHIWKSRRLPHVAALVAPVLLSVAVYLAINYEMTGNPMVPSYSREFASRGVKGGNIIGFGTDYPISVGGTGVHTVGQGMLNSCLNLTHLNLWLLGWPLSLLIPLFAPFNIWTRLCLLALSLEAVLYTTFYNPGLSVTGPTYFYDSAVFLVVMSAAAILRVPKEWTKSRGAGPFVIAVIVVNLALFLPMQVRSISGTTEGTSLLSRTIDHENVHHAVVFVKNVQGEWRPEVPYKSFSYHPASNASFDDSVVILNTVSPEKDRDVLNRYFPGRSGYLYSVDADWTPHLDPIQ